MTGNAANTRAVGNANGKNKINIVVPCHRVIGSNGKLTGYGGGLWRKEILLKHEMANTLQGLFASI
jgi:methylated-DNA-[protein]-cysteine S-methyltransferase